MLWFSQKISAVSDTACGSESYLCAEQSAVSRPLLGQGLLRGLFRLRHSLNPLLSSPGRHCHGNQTGWALSAGKCWVYQDNAALHLPLLKQKSKSCSGSCGWYQWYLSVLAVVLPQQCMSIPATVKSWQIAPIVQTLYPGKFSEFSCFFDEIGMGKGQALPCLPKLKWPAASASLLLILLTRTLVTPT